MATVVSPLSKHSKQTVNQHFPRFLQWKAPSSLVTTCYIRNLIITLRQQNWGRIIIILVSFRQRQRNLFRSRYQIHYWHLLFLFTLPLVLLSSQSRFCFQYRPTRWQSFCLCCFESMQSLKQCFFGAASSTQVSADSFPSIRIRNASAAYWRDMSASTTVIEASYPHPHSYWVDVYKWRSFFGGKKSVRNMYWYW